MELKRKRSKERKDDKGTVYKIQKKEYNRRKSAGMRKERDPIPRIQNKEKETMVELKSGSTPHRGKDIAEQCMDRSSKKHSTREEQAKRHQKNIQNTKKSVAEYQGRESEYA